MSLNEWKLNFCQDVLPKISCFLLRPNYNLTLQSFTNKNLFGYAPLNLQVVWDKQTTGV